MNIRVSTESLILVGVCMADMILTLYCVLAGIAREQNPLMAACIKHSPITFVLVKVTSFVPFVIAVELFRRKNPVFARLATRCAIAIYVLVLATLTVAVNAA